MDDIIQSIQNKLGELAELKYIDEDSGQLDYYSPRFPVKWPCALIDVPSLNFDNVGYERSIRQSQGIPQNRQMAKGVVSITIANLKLTNSSGKAPQGQKDNVWSIWTVIDKVHDLLHGFKPTGNTSALIRTAVRRNKRDDGIQEYTLLYSFAQTNV